MKRKLLVIITVDFVPTTDHIFCIRQVLEKKCEYNETLNQHFKDFKKSYDSVRRELLYNILTEFCIPMKMVKLIIIICLSEKYSKSGEERICLTCFLLGMV
jgi:predicted PolB exonuclease-like 3'-5' exonuclease